MTDNDIIKALECHTGNDSKRCQVCPYTIYGCYCLDHLHPDLLELINRKNEEIERLKLECYKLYPKGCAYSMQVEASDRLEHQIKSEAIKEFAEKFSKELSEFDMSSVGLPDYDRGYKDCMTAIEDTIDNLVEEMTEEI